MNYQIKRIKVGQLLLTSLLFMVATFGTVIFLSLNEIFLKSNPILPILLFGGIGGCILIFFFSNHGDKVCTITKDELVIDSTTIKWNEIKSYKIKDDSSEFKILKIKCKNGKAISIGHRKKYATKDEFESFLSAFEDKVFNLNQQNYNISQTPLIWETKWGKWYGYALIVILIVFTIILFDKGFKAKAIANYLIFIGISLPILVRIFRKKTS